MACLSGKCCVFLYWNEAVKCCVVGRDTLRDANVCWKSSWCSLTKWMFLYIWQMLQRCTAVIGLICHLPNSIQSQGEPMRIKSPDWNILLQIEMMSCIKHFYWIKTVVRNVEKPFWIYSVSGVVYNFSALCSFCPLFLSLEHSSAIFTCITLVFCFFTQ